MPQSPHRELPDDRPAVRPAGLVDDEFEHMLAEALALAGAERREDALEACWSARRLAKRHQLERVGEADLMLGLLLLDVDRMNEGLEALYRAVRYFAQRGQLALRGHAEALLAEAAWLRGEDQLAERHLKVAGDLLVSSADPGTASEALEVHAERLAAAGRRLGAARMLHAANRLSLVAEAS